MIYRKLGTTGLEVSAICLGCMTYGDTAWRPWILGEDHAREHFRLALDGGINFFDTADMYSNGVSEEVTGKLLREMVPRDDYVLASKVFFPVADGPNRGGLSRKHILASCDDSLRRLGHDYIDLYQIHRWDPSTPVEETLEALDSLVRAGKVRYLGASSMAAWQFSKALHTAGEHGWQRFVAMQNHYNLVYREEEREMLPLCEAERVGVIPWSPLARGLLAGTRTALDDKQSTLRAESDGLSQHLYQQDSDWNVVEAVRGVAKERSVEPAQIALAWLRAKPTVTAPIIGATKLPHLEAAIASLDIELTEEEITQLEAPYEPHPVRGIGESAVLAQLRRG